MLRKREVTVGKYYVNNERKIARAVLGVSDKTVKFDTYHLNTGNSCGSHSECTLQEFTRWADREATLAEMAGLPHHEMEAVFRAPELPNLEELEHNLEIDPTATQLMQKTTLKR